MILKCNGVRGLSKQVAFRATLDIHNPDVLWCESTLCNSVCTYKFIPKNYSAFYKDCYVNGGVASTDRIISYEIPDLDTDYEMIWAGLHFSGSKPPYSASFYEPSNAMSLCLWSTMEFSQLSA